MFYFRMLSFYYTANQTSFQEAVKTFACDDTETVESHIFISTPKLSTRGT